MPKTVILLSAILLLGTFSLTAQNKTDDRHSVERAVMDYVEGVYNLQPERIRRSVHPELAKRGFFQRDGSYREAKMTFEQLAALSKNYNKDGIVPDGAPKKIEIYEVLDQTASAKLTAFWGIDYMQLAKFDGKWQIVNVLWQSHPAMPAPASQEAEQAAESGRPGGMVGLLGGPQLDTGIREIQLERTPCYGTCPAYRVVLKSDGSGKYFGKMYVKQIGEFSGNVNQWYYNKLAEFIRKSDFMKFQDYYTAEITDMPTTITTVVMQDGTTKQVSNYANTGPASLWAIEQVIDKFVSDIDWKPTSENMPNDK